MGALDGRNIVVTGSGRGIGAEVAKFVAKHGANVVVNDPGVNVDGSGNDAGPADEVVKEITAAGGTAVANYDSVATVEGGENMIKQAVDAWGRVDAVIHVAGILRDRMVFNMSEEEWDAVIRVHLKGHFCPTRHAVGYWRDLSKSSDGPVYGRIVNTSSEAGLMGSAGQPNYGTAKGGIIQLTLSTAQGMKRYGVNANAIAPRALTQMTEQLGGFDAKEGDFEVFAPENVSPLVAYLGSPASERVSGQVFVVWGRQISVLAGPTVDEQVNTEDHWTPENVSKALTPLYEKREPIKDGFLLKH
jgi:3-oxoacyl-[acyl-carrier protein] reductase